MHQQGAVLSFYFMGNIFPQLNVHIGLFRGFHLFGLNRHDQVHRAVEPGGNQGALAKAENIGIVQLQPQFLVCPFDKIIIDRMGGPDCNG